MMKCHAHIKKEMATQHPNVLKIFKAGKFHPKISLNK